MIRPAIDIAIVIVTVCVLYTFFSGRAQEKRAALHTRCLACLLEGHGASTYMASTFRETTDKPRQDILSTNVHLSRPCLLAKSSGREHME